MEPEGRPPAAAALEAVVTALPGRVLVLGDVRASLLTALWEHAARVDHLVEEGRAYTVAARRAGVRHHHWRTTGFADPADAVLVDVDRSHASFAFEEIRARLRPGAGSGSSARRGA